MDGLRVSGGLVHYWVNKAHLVKAVSYEVLKFWLCKEKIILTDAQALPAVTRWLHSTVHEFSAAVSLQLQCASWCVVHKALPSTDPSMRQCA